MPFRGKGQFTRGGWGHHNRTWSSTQLVAEHRQDFRAEIMDEWILLNKLLTTQEATEWNAVRRLVPGHVMRSLSEVT